nr:hypothetical protein [Tanacetum cinerariifolium]
MWPIRFNWSSMCMKWLTAPAHINLGPDPQLLTPGTISSRLVPQPPYPTPNVPLTKNDWDTLFCPMFDEYFNPSPSVVQLVLVVVVQEPIVSTGTPSSTRINQDTPSTSTLQTTQESQSYVIPTSVKEDNHGIKVAHMDNDLLYTSSLLNADCKKALNLLKKGLLIRGEAVEASKRRRSLLDHKLPKVQVKDLVLFQRFPMSQRTILVAQATYFLNLIIKFKMSPMMR